MGVYEIPCHGYKGFHHGQTKRPYIMTFSVWCKDLFYELHDVLLVLIKKLLPLNPAPQLHELHQLSPDLINDLDAYKAKRERINHLNVFRAKLNVYIYLKGLAVLVARYVLFTKLKIILARKPLACWYNFTGLPVQENIQTF